MEQKCVNSQAALKRSPAFNEACSTSICFKQTQKNLRCANGVLIRTFVESNYRLPCFRPDLSGPHQPG